MQPTIRRSDPPAVKQSRGLDGPFIFTSAGCAVYARIHAAGNRRGKPNSNQPRKPRNSYRTFRT
jgi:hypothetical protein